jgi:hypothetical protein
MIKYNGDAIVYIYGTFGLHVWDLSITFTHTIYVNMWLSYDNAKSIT